LNNKKLFEEIESLLYGLSIAASSDNQMLYTKDILVFLLKL